MYQEGRRLSICLEMTNMLDLTIKNLNGLKLFTMGNCGKEGSMVAKRLASLNDGVASTKARHMRVDREVDRFYLR